MIQEENTTKRHTKEIGFFNRFLVGFLGWLTNIRLLNPLSSEILNREGEKENNENILLSDFADKLPEDSDVRDRV